MYLGSLFALGIGVLGVFKFIYELGKKDKEKDINSINNKMRYDKIKSMQKTSNWLKSLSLDKLNKLLRSKD